MTPKPAPFLVSPAQARWYLGDISDKRLRALIAAGKIQAHPELADRIIFESLEKFALHYGDNAETDNAIRQPLDDPATENWGTPSMCIRANGR